MKSSLRVSTKQSRRDTQITTDSDEPHNNIVLSSQLDGSYKDHVDLHKKSLLSIKMSLFLPIFIFTISAVFGINILSAWKIFKEKILILAAGTVLGLVVTITLIYLLTAFVLLSHVPIIIILSLEIAAIYIINSHTKAWIFFKRVPTDKTALFIFIALLIIFSFITPKILIDDTANNNGLSTGMINAYGDLGFHMANITNLAYSQTIPPADPILSGNYLTYPFFSNFLSAMLLIGGASYSQAVNLPAFILIPITLILFYCLVRSLSNNKKVALIALLLFAFGGSTIGWLFIIDDFPSLNNLSIELLANLPRNYTGHSGDINNLQLVNPIISLLIPQRSFMFGMPLAFIILLLLIRKEKSNHFISFLLAGLLAGLLPLFHAHTVIVLIPLILLLLTGNPHRDWRIFFITTIIVGLPGALYYITSDASASTTPHLQLGWMSNNNNFIVFWLKNSGLLIPITIFGLFLPTPNNIKIFAATGLAIFSAANIWLFAAWEWDNTKLFVYWSLFTLPLIAYTAVHFWQKGNHYVRGIIISLIIFHILSGSIDVLRLTLPKTQTWPEWDNDNIAMAELIRSNTTRQDTILIAPYHNSPAALSGRAVYLGFPGHVWTHGGNHIEREEAVKQFYNGEIEQLPQLQPQYVIVSPVEHSFYPELYIRPHWQLIGRKGAYELYKL